MTKIKINIDLPDHTESLEKAEEYIKEKQNKLKSHIQNKKIDEQTYRILYDDIIQGLEYLGFISTPIFNIQNKIELLYEKTYKHSPELGKKLKWEKIAEIHRPYNILKNRLFRLLDELMFMYEKINNCSPPEFY